MQHENGLRLTVADIASHIQVSLWILSVFGFILRDYLQLKHVVKNSCKLLSQILCLFLNNVPSVAGLITIQCTHSCRHNFDPALRLFSWSICTSKP
jgi:hypothetical protein